VYYAFRRHGIDIPFPAQVTYIGPDTAVTLATDADRIGWIDAVDVFALLAPADREALATLSRERLYGAGQTIVKQDDTGDSMFVIGRGSVRVTILPGATEVARLSAGSYFGEMSLLTGQPRTATVSAITDCVLLEISAAEFRRIALAQPAVVEQVTHAVAERQAGLARSREGVSPAAVPADSRRGFLLKVREFLKL
jgi:CRP-like cAMP-binding protein